MNAIIIDDEPAARRLIRHLCAQHAKHINIVAEGSNGTEAIYLIDTEKPDLVFLDIQMPDITGFKVLAKVAHQPNIIFTTAYEEFAIKAFEAFAVDYLLKPIKEERFVQAIEKLQHFRKAHDKMDFNKVQQLINELKPQKEATTLTVKTGDKIILLSFDDIVYLEANDKYLNIVTTNGHKYLSDLTLTMLAEKLPTRFLRVQKSFIINKQKIKELLKHFNGRYVIIMNDTKQSRITTGLTFYDSIRRELGI